MVAEHTMPPVESGSQARARFLFSIVTPSLDQGRYISDALSSVRCQENVRCEHVVMDAGSCDGTVDILSEAEGSLRFFVEPDDGQSDALNKGFKLARGSILGWLNADDFYLRGALAVVERCFASNPEVQVVYGDAVIVDENGCVIRGLNQHGPDLAMLLYYGCYIPSTTTFFRSDLLDSGLLRLDTSLRLAMDLDLFIRLAKAGVKFAYLPRELAAFRWHQQAKTLLGGPSGMRERSEIQARYGAATNSELALEVLRTLYRVKHGIKKILSGAYGRQFRWSRARAQSMRWWDVDIRGQGASQNLPDDAEGCGSQAHRGSQEDAM